jgi:hypothetical protein
VREETLGPKKLFKGVAVDREVSDRLQAIKAHAGLSEAEQIRRGIQLWLELYEWPVGSPSRDPDGPLRTS